MKRTERKNEDVMRRSELAAIHIGRSQLGLDEDTYRDMLARVSAEHGVAHRSARPSW